MANLSIRTGSSIQKYEVTRFNNLSSRNPEVNQWKEYYDEFVSVINGTRLSIDHLIDSFMDGREEEILCMVKMFRPQTLHNAYFLAKLQELTLRTQNPKKFEITFMSNTTKRVVPPLECDKKEVAGETEVEIIEEIVSRKVFDEMSEGILMKIILMRYVAMDAITLKTMELHSSKASFFEFRRNQVGTLKRVGRTCQGSHFHSVCSLLEMINPICVVLKGIIDDTSACYPQRGDADSTYTHMKSFEFVFILHLIKEKPGKTSIILFLKLFKINCKIFSMPSS